jgi:hypothetical protein
VEITAMAMRTECFDVRRDIAAGAPAVEGAVKPSAEPRQSVQAEIEGGSPLSGVAVALSLLLWIVIAVLLWKLMH